MRSCHTSTDLSSRLSWKYFLLTSVNLSYSLFFLIFLFLLFSRELHYFPFTLSPTFDESLGIFLQDMVFWFLLCGLSLIYISQYPLWFGLLFIIIALAIFKWGILKKENFWTFHPFMYFLIWPIIIFYNFLFDINPSLALAILVSILLTMILLIFRTSHGSPEKLIPWAAVTIFLFFLPLANDFWDICAFVVWGCVLIIFQKFLSHLCCKDGLLLLILLMPIPQVISAFAPLILSLHGGTELGKHLAHSFCQSPKNGHIFATVPQCLSQFKEGREQCKQGYIAEYDSAFQYIKTHQFFSDSRYGRLEGITCLQDSLMLGISDLSINEEFFGANAVELFLEKEKDPKNFFPFAFGSGISYFAPDDTLYFTYEFSNKIVKYKRNTDTWSQFIHVAGNRSGRVLAGDYAIHYQRHSLFAFEVMMGSKVHEVSLDDLSTLRSYPVNNGGAIGGVIDEELDRVLVTGLWGLDVIDLKTGKRVQKLRLGLLSRSPVIDKEHNLIFVSSNITGKMFILDRHSLTIVRTLLIGFGTRNSYISLDSQTLFASSVLNHFYWNIEQLIPRERAD